MLYVHTYHIALYGSQLISFAFLTYSSGILAWSSVLLMRWLFSVAPNNALCDSFGRSRSDRWQRRGLVLHLSSAWCHITRCGCKTKEHTILIFSVMTRLKYIEVGL